jgi:hypothetical protein
MLYDFTKYKSYIFAFFLHGPGLDQGPNPNLLTKWAKTVCQRVLTDFLENQAFLQSYDLAPPPPPSVSLTGDSQED